MMRLLKDAFVGKSVSIVICTHNRRKLLLRALRSLETLYVEDYYNVSILIVENEPEPFLERELKSLKLPFPLNYVHESSLGLVMARNRGLDEAEKLGVDWLLMIDDDVEVDPDLLVRHEQAASEIIDGYVFVGANVYRYKNGYSKFLEKVSASKLKLGEFPIVMTTANLMIHSKLFAQSTEGYRFDKKFNFSGSEDAEFLLRLRDDEHKVSYVPEAITYEDTDRDRGKYGVLFRRIIRQQTNMLTIQRGRKSLTEFFMYSLQALARNATYTIIEGSRGVLFLVAKPKNSSLYLGRAGLHIARIMGVVGYFVNFSPAEYDRGELDT